MKIKDGFIKTEIADKIVAIPVGANTVDFSGVVVLNETAAFLWDLMQTDTDKQTLLKAVLNEYDTDEKSALSDIDAFLQNLRDKDFLCE